MKTIQLFLMATVLLFSCAKSQTLSPDVPLLGNWGGRGIALVASDKEVNLNFDCGAGIIPQKVVLSSNKFSEKGTYTQGTGVLPVDYEPKPKPVLYEATLASDTLTLVMKSEDGKTTMATYTLGKNVFGKIYRCL